jgi:hypothetical protein
MSWNFVRFHEITNQSCWKFQISILTNKKVLFLKKISSVPCTMDSSFFRQKMATWRPNFPHQRLWLILADLPKNDTHCSPIWICFFHDNRCPYSIHRNHLASHQAQIQPYLSNCRIGNSNPWMFLHYHVAGQFLVGCFICQIDAWTV